MYSNSYTTYTVVIALISALLNAVEAYTEDIEISYCNADTLMYDPTLYGFLNDVSNNLIE